MPQYEKITAKSFKEARNIAFQKYGSDISIVKERSRESKNWKNLWRSKSQLCEIVIAKYKNREELLPSSVYRGSFDELEEGKGASINASASASANRNANIDNASPQKKLQNFNKILEKKHNLINAKLKNLSIEKASWEQSIEKFKTEKIPSPTKEGLQSDWGASFDEGFFKKPQISKQHEAFAVRFASPVLEGVDFGEEKKQIHSDETFWVENFLKQQRFSSDLIKILTKNCPVKDLDSEESFKRLAAKIASHFSFSQDFFSEKDKNFFFFLGAPGVGKTTTFFKTAVDLVKAKNSDVFLACYDQKRLMGTTQVEKFSDILQVPFRRLESSACLKRLKKECTPNTTFLVDLGGLSLLDHKQVDEYKNLFSGVEKNKKTILVLNASMGEEEIDFSLKQFVSSFAIDGLALCHIDQARSLGPALSAIHNVNLPISLLCYGQDIPHDMRFATSKNLEEKLLGFFTQNAME